MKHISTMLAVLVAIAASETKVYDVPPYQCCNGFTAGVPNAYVAQTFVANVDTLLWAEVFVGKKPSTPGQNGYRVEVLDCGQRLYNGYATDTLEYVYTRAELAKEPGQPSLVKGKTYTLKVSHTGDQPVNYFYDPTDPYAYGQISVGGGWGQPEPV